MWFLTTSKLLDNYISHFLTTSYIYVLLYSVKGRVSILYLKPSLWVSWPSYQTTGNMEICFGSPLPLESWRQATNCSHSWHHFMLGNPVALNIFWGWFCFMAKLNLFPRVSNSQTWKVYGSTCFCPEHSEMLWAGDEPAKLWQGCFIVTLWGQWSCISQRTSFPCSWGSWELIQKNAVHWQEAYSSSHSSKKTQH